MLFALVDKEADPLLWAEIHEPLVHLLLDYAELDRADDLISDIIDIREERQGESHRDLAETLILWAELLYARANYSGMESVAARAGRIYAQQNPPDLSGFSIALNSQAVALQKCSCYFVPRRYDQLLRESEVIEDVTKVLECEAALPLSQLLAS